MFRRVACILVCSFTHVAFAASETECLGDFKSVDSLSALPAEIQHNLVAGVGDPQLMRSKGWPAITSATVPIANPQSFQGPIAEAGGAFRATDVVLDESVPTRRLLFAAATPTDIAVSIEHGGRGYFMEYWQFHKAASGWVLLSAGYLHPKPMNWEAFVRSICRD